MGQNIQKTLSCVDCSSSRVVTLEDQESSCCLKGRELQSLGNSSEKDDEITVFESPVKLKRKKLYKGVQGRGLGERTIVRKLNSRLFASSKKVLGNVRTSGYSEEEGEGQERRKGDEYPGSEISTPSMITYASRYRTYSSNLSPISTNIVESIRKNSFYSCGNADKDL